MSTPVEFFFDFMSPYSYLAATRVEAMVAPVGGEVVWRPCFLPAILRATDNRGPAEIPAKLAYITKDLVEWCRVLGLPEFGLPEGFPFLATQADRCALVAGDRGKAGPFSRAMFDAIWKERRDATSPEVIGVVLRSVGLDADEVLALASSPELKTRLRTVSDEAVARGAFGVPTFFVGDEMFVGNDRLDFVVRRLRAAR